MKADSLINNIKEFVDVDTVHMYIIERRQKAEANSKTKPSERFEYTPLQVNLSPLLMTYVKEMLSKAIDKKVKDGVEIREYEVIDDTIDKVYTYNNLDKLTGFNEFLRNKLNKEIKQLQSFKELEDIEKAWALCYGFYNAERKKWLYCIKKLAPRRVAIDVHTSTSIKEAVKNGINSYFDLETKTLMPYNGFSINLEANIDMIYLDEEVYVFQKKAFEDITSLTEEFETLATHIVTEIEEIELVDGLAFITAIVSNKPAYRNKLIKAKSIGNLDFLKNCKDVKKEFNRTGKKLNIKFNFNADGKIIALNEADAENIIKVLCEYFKEGIFGGKVFESPAGRVRQSTNGN
jgi:hypothetical protein